MLYEVITFSIIERYFSLSSMRRFTLVLAISLMGLVLSIDGIMQAGFIPLDTELMWELRALYGALFLAALIWWMPENITQT